MTRCVVADAWLNCTRAEKSNAPYPTSVRLWISVVVPNAAKIPPRAVCVPLTAMFAYPNVLLATLLSKVMLALEGFAVEPRDEPNGEISATKSL